MKVSDIRTCTATLPPRVLIHGQEGVGKTTLGVAFPRPVFLQTEDGCPGCLEIATFGVIAKFGDLVEAIGSLGNDAHDFQTVVLDSLDALEPLVWSALCRDRSWPSIESPGYGKGYVEADRWWQDLLTGLDWLRRTRSMIVVLLAHSAIETVNDPRAPSYTSYQLRIHKRARALVQDWSDVIGFLSTDLTIHSEDAGFAKKRARADGGSMRYLHLEPRPSFVAKNRYGLPAKMPIPKGFSFDKQLAPFFPTPARREAASSVVRAAAPGGPNEP